MKKIKPLPAADMEILRKTDTATVCNLIELFDVRPRTSGYMDGRIKACFPQFPPMVGYATTASFRSSAPCHIDAYAAQEEQIASMVEADAPTVVVFQDLDDPTVAATFGEVMCSTYQAFGGQGLITSGAGRDLKQVSELGFPVFTSGTICSHGNCHILHINAPVHVGGLIVNPGDLLHGDENGVTTIPIEIASAVAETSAEFVALEDIIISYVKSGSVALKGLVGVRTEFRRKLGELVERVRKGN